MRKIHLWSAFAILLMFAGNAFADPITYTESATASGTLGANSFTDALITLSFTGNTTNVAPGIPGVLMNNPGPDTVTLTVADLGTSTFTNDVYVFFADRGDDSPLGPAYAAGFTDETPLADILDTDFQAAYGLTTTLDPVSGTAIINAGYGFSTTDGTFTIDSIDGDSTFSSLVTYGTPPVPEPSSILLLGTGLLGAAAALRRKLKVNRVPHS